MRHIVGAAGHQVDLGEQGRNVGAATPAMAFAAAAAAATTRKTAAAAAGIAAGTAAPAEAPIAVAGIPGAAREACRANAAEARLRAVTVAAIAEPAGAA